MRNPKRIKPVLEQLAKIWAKSPDLRLGQLLWAIGRDPFHIEDYDMLQVLANRVEMELDVELPEYYIEPNAWNNIKKVEMELNLRMLGRKPNAP